MQLKGLVLQGHVRAITQDVSLHAVLRVGHIVVVQRASVKDGLEAALGFKVTRETSFQGEVLQGSISSIKIKVSKLHTFVSPLKRKTQSGLG